MNQQIVTVPLHDHIISFHFQHFDSDVDIDDLCKIHYHNLPGELATINMLVNKIGILRATMEHKFSEAEREYDVYCAAMRKHYRKTLMPKKLSIQELADELSLDVGVQTMLKNLYLLERNKKYIEAMYWGIDKKCKILTNLGKSITPEEFESGLVEETVNSFFIKKHKKVI